MRIFFFFWGGEVEKVKKNAIFTNRLVTKNLLQYNTIKPFKK